MRYIPVSYDQPVRHHLFPAPGMVRDLWRLSAVDRHPYTVALGELLQELHCHVTQGRLFLTDYQLVLAAAGDVLGYFRCSVDQLVRLQDSHYRAAIVQRIGAAMLGALALTNPVLESTSGYRELRYEFGI